MRVKILFVAVLFLALGQAVAQDGPVAPDIVAKVNGRLISSAELDKEITNYRSFLAEAGLSKERLDSRKARLEYLKNELVPKYLLYQEALRRGLDKKGDIIRQGEEVDALVNKLVRQESEKLEVSGQEIEDFFKAEPGQGEKKPQGLQERRQEIKDYLLFEKEQAAINNLVDELKSQAQVELYEDNVK